MKPGLILLYTAIVIGIIIILVLQLRFIFDPMLAPMSTCKQL